MADGSLKFDTKIDTESAEKDLETLKNRLNRVIQSVKTAGDSTANAFAGTESIDSTNARIAQMITEIDQLKDGLYYMEKEGFYFGDKEYDEAYSKLARLQRELKDYKKTLAGTNSQYKEASSSIKSLGKAVENTNTKTKKYNSTLKILKMSLMISLAFRALSSAMKAIGEGFQNLVQYSADANKSISALKTSTQTLKNSFATAFAPILTTVTPALVTLINVMSNALTVAGQFFAVMMTGASTFTKAKDAQVDYADSLKKTSKEAEGSLASFDKLNNQSDSGASTDGSASIGDMFEEVKIDNNIVTFVENLKEKLQPLIDAFGELKKALDPMTQMVFDSVTSFYKDVLVPVGDWALGKGLPGLLTAASNLLSEVDWNKLSRAISDFNKAIAPLAIAVGQGFIDFITDLSEVLKPAIAATADVLASAIKSIADTLKGADPQAWKDAGYAIGVIGTTLGAIKIVEGLPAFLLGVGNGLGSIVTGLSNLAYMNPVALPALFDVLGLNQWLDGLYEKLPDWARGLWEGFWKVVADLLTEIFNYDQMMSFEKDMVAKFNEAFDNDGDSWLEIGKNILIGILDGFAAAISLITEPIFDFFTSLIQNICDVFGINSPAEEMKPYGQYILQGIIEGFKNAFSEWWESIESWGTETFNKFKTWGGSIWSGIKASFTNAPTWFKTKFELAWTNIKTAFSGVKEWFQGNYDAITGIFSSIPKWFKDKFTEAWTNVKNVFSTGGKIYDGIKDGIADSFKTVVQKLVDGINSIIKVPFEKINGMLNSIRNVSVLGLKPFTNLWSQNPISTPQIPALATGTVIPPNSEFLALLGDQKKGVNIEAPLDTIVEAFKAVVGQGNGSDGKTHLTIQLGMKTIYDGMVKIDKETVVTTGKSGFAY